MNSTPNLACEHLQGLHVYPCQCCHCPANAAAALGADPPGLPSFCSPAHQLLTNHSPTTKIPNSSISVARWRCAPIGPPQPRTPSTSTRRSPFVPAPTPALSGSPGRFFCRLLGPTGCPRDLALPISMRRHIIASSPPHDRRVTTRSTTTWLRVLPGPRSRPTTTRSSHGGP